LEEKIAAIREKAPELYQHILVWEDQKSCTAPIKGFKGI